MLVYHAALCVAEAKFELGSLRLQSPGSPPPAPMLSVPRDKGKEAVTQPDRGWQMPSLNPRAKPFTRLVSFPPPKSLILSLQARNREVTVQVTWLKSHSHGISLGVTAYTVVNYIILSDVGTEGVRRCAPFLSGV